MKVCEAFKDIAAPTFNNFPANHFDLKGWGQFMEHKQEVKRNSTFKRNFTFLINVLREPAARISVIKIISSFDFTQVPRNSRMFSCLREYRRLTSLTMRFFSSSGTPVNRTFHPTIPVQHQIKCCREFYFTGKGNCKTYLVPGNLATLKRVVRLINCFESAAPQYFIKLQFDCICKKFF